MINYDNHNLVMGFVAKKNPKKVKNPMIFSDDKETKGK